MNGFGRCIFKLLIDNVVIHFMLWA